jgi:hypothetical protein
VDDFSAKYFLIALFFNAISVMSGRQLTTMQRHQAEAYRRFLKALKLSPATWVRTKRLYTVYILTVIFVCQ